MKFIIVGAQGQVGQELSDLIDAKGHSKVCLDRDNFDITDQSLVNTVINANKDVDIVINAAAYTAVDKAEDEPEIADQINHVGVQYLAEACKAHNLPLFHISTDYVFAGDKPGAYVETDQTNPLGVYGKTKLAGDIALISTWKKHIILRVSWVFGRYGNNFVKTMLRLAGEREELSVVADQFGCPTPAKDIARVLIEIAEKLNQDDSRWGIYHYCGADRTNWYEFAQTAIELGKAKSSVKLKRLLPITTADYPTKAARPQNSEMSTDKLTTAFDIQRHDWRDYLKEMIEQI